MIAKATMKDRFNIQIFADSCVGSCKISSDSDDHPNRMPFSGTLLIVDEPSTKPPNGSEGHKILVPKEVAQKNLKSLIGMGLNYQPNNLSGHMPRHKVGVIDGAKIDGNAVKVWGHIFAKDFPETKRELKGKNIGMSMELANVLVKNKHDPIWKLIDFSFTGATALLKSAAAYNKTSLSATAEREIEKLLIGENVMATKEKKRKKEVLSGSSRVLGNLVENISSSIEKSIAKGFKSFGDKLDTIANTVKDQGQAIAAMAAGSAEEGLEDSSDGALHAEGDSSDNNASVQASADEDELAAAGESSGGTVTAKKAKDDSSSSSSSTTMSSDDDDLDAELAKLGEGAKGTKAGPDEESSNPELGKLNKNAKNKGRKTEVNASGIHQVVRIAAAASKRVKSLKAHAEKLKKDIRAERKGRKKLESQVEEMQAQIDEFTENNITSRAIPSDLNMLLTKGGANVDELRASGRKLSVQEVDDLFASSNITLSPVERMTFKNKLLENDLMEQGEVSRTR